MSWRSKNERLRLNIPRFDNALSIFFYSSIMMLKCYLRSTDRVLRDTQIENAEKSASFNH